MCGGRGKKSRSTDLAGGEKRTNKSTRGPYSGTGGKVSASLASSVSFSRAPSSVLGPGLWAQMTGFPSRPLSLFRPRSAPLAERWGVRVAGGEGRGRGTGGEALLGVSDLV